MYANRMDLCVLRVPTFFPDQVGILGNASDFYGSGLEDTTSSYGNMDRRKMMIAFDMRYVVNL